MAGDEFYDDDVTSGPIGYMTDTLAARLFGRSRDTAWAKGECVRCRVVVWEACLATPDLREYRITALCPSCFAKVTDE